MDLTAKTAIVTGSTGKLGSQIALFLAESGFNVICHYNSNESRAVDIVKTISANKGRAFAIKADLSDYASYSRLFEYPSDFPSLGLLVNSASIFQRVPLSGIQPDILEKTFSLNVIAPLQLSSIFAERVIGNAGSSGSALNESNCPWAKIINITDIAADLNWANYSAYCASKAALVSVTKSLAKELAPRITVNAVSPGIVSWPEGFDDQDRLYQISKIPLGRAADASEICSAIDFLVKNDYLTGQVINVDGGRSL